MPYRWRSDRPLSRLERSAMAQSWRDRRGASSGCQTQGRSLFPCLRGRSRNAASRGRALARWTPPLEVSGSTRLRRRAGHDRPRPWRRARSRRSRRGGFGVTSDSRCGPRVRYACGKGRTIAVIAGRTLRSQSSRLSTSVVTFNFPSGGAFSGGVFTVIVSPTTSTYRNCSVPTQFWNDDAFT